MCVYWIETIKNLKCTLIVLFIWFEQEWSGFLEQDFFFSSFWQNYVITRGKHYFNKLKVDFDMKTLQNQFLFTEKASDKRCVAWTLENHKCQETNLYKSDYSFELL